MLIEPVLGDLAVYFGAGGEEANAVAFFVPLIYDAECIGIGQAGTHPLRLLIRDVVANGTVDVDQKVLYAAGQNWADQLTLYVERSFEGSIHLFSLFGGSSEKLLKCLS